jgi:hypothetical protein
MTLGNALSAVFEWGTVCAAIIGVYVIVGWAFNGVRAVWRRLRVHQELSHLDKLSLEALARYRRDIK